MCVHEAASKVGKRNSGCRHTETMCESYLKVVKPEQCGRYCEVQ